MIASLQGTLEARGSDFVIVNVGGVSFRVHLPTSTLSELGSVGERVQLRTHLYVREDNLALYGFASDEELGLFELLISVAGVGPKVALSMLSAMSPEHLTGAIGSGNVELLTGITGVGKKMASRIVLELKGKLEAVGVPVPVMTETNADVLAALRALGYSASEARSAVSALPEDKDLTLEDKVRLALQQVGRK